MLVNYVWNLLSLVRWSLITGNCYRHGLNVECWSRARTPDWTWVGVDGLNMHFKWTSSSSTTDPIKCLLIVSGGGNWTAATDSSIVNMSECIEWKFHQWTATDMKCCIIGTSPIWVNSIKSLNDRQTMVLLYGRYVKQLQIVLRSIQYYVEINELEK